MGLTKGKRGPYTKIARELGISTELVRQIAKRIRQPPRETLRAGEAANVLGVHVNTVRRWADQGKLRMYRLSDRSDRLFRREDLEKFLRGGETGGDPVQVRTG